VLPLTAEFLRSHSKWQVFSKLGPIRILKSPHLSFLLKSSKEQDYEMIDNDITLDNDNPETMVRLIYDSYSVKEVE
jgi:hypothetical protein